MKMNESIIDLNMIYILILLYSYFIGVYYKSIRVYDYTKWLMTKNYRFCNLCIEIKFSWKCM